MKLSKGKINKTFNKKNISNKRIKGGKKKYKKSSNKNKKDKHISNKSIKIKKGKNKRKRSIQVGGIPDDDNMKFWKNLFNTLSSIVIDKDVNESKESKDKTGISEKAKVAKLKNERDDILKKAGVVSIDGLKNNIASLERNKERLEELNAKTEQQQLTPEEQKEKEKLEKSAEDDKVKLEKYEKAKKEYDSTTKEIVEKSGKKSFTKMPETQCSSSKSGNVRLLEVTKENQGLIYGNNDFITVQDINNPAFQFIVAKPTTFVKPGDKLIIKLPTDLEVSENQTITRLKKEIDSLEKILNNATRRGFSLCALLNGDFSSLSKLNPMGSRNCDDDDDDDDEEETEAKK
jgi:hypothetical protein